MATPTAESDSPKAKSEILSLSRLLMLAYVLPNDATVHRAAANDIDLRIRAARVSVCNGLLCPFVTGLYGVGRFPTTLICQVDMALRQQLLQALRARLGNVCVRKLEEFEFC